MHGKPTAWVSYSFVRVLPLVWLSLQAAGLRAPAGASGRPAQAQPEVPIPSVRVGAFTVTSVNMQEALKLLVAKNVSNVVIGFERLPHPEGDSDKRVSLHLANATVGDVIRELYQADSRYEYEVVPDRLIEVQPKRARQNPEDLLSIRVTEYSIDRNELPGGAIEQIAQDAPELREFLDRKVNEWIKKTGRYPGYPGSIISGNITPPRFTLKLHNVTVREILNAIALQSIEMFKEHRLYGPAGWEYDFVIDANAANGLRGYPRWTVF